MHEIILSIVKNPILFIPISVLGFQILHKINIGRCKEYYSKEFPVSLQMLMFSINVSYVFKDTYDGADFYKYIVTVSQLFFVFLSSIISKKIYEEESGSNNLLKRILLGTVLYCISIPAIYLLIHTMKYKI